MLPVVVVHGGAGLVPRERSEGATLGVCSAARVGYAILKGGGSSMDALVETVSQLENNPSFNAGCGSVLNIKGDVEMDAMVMDGKTLGSGAVSCVRNIANPIQLARLVMDKTSHAFLTADGANLFARSMCVPEVPQESLITEYSRMRWRKNLEPGSNPVESQMGKMGTVGAVAVDSQGNVACATSTGGIINKMEGRVGDTPCIGSGSYADNNIGAVSNTGDGEAIMRVTLARLILFHIEQGHSVEAASDLGLAHMKSRVHGLGGVVTVDPQGHWAARFSSTHMVWAAAQNDTLHYGLHAGEHFTQSLRCGSVLNIKGDVEMDAMVMDGKTLGSGAVSCVRNIANPIQLARLVMDKTSHVFLTGDGASQFARSMGVPEVPQESLITEYSRMRWMKNQAPGANPAECQMGKMGTVGAVAVDSEGNVACATSTGGLINKMEGRVGDTPCIGSGGYADNSTGAVSSTGDGEYIMRVTLARLIVFYIEQGHSVEAATDLGLAHMKSRVHGLGGVVTVDPQGHWAARFSSQEMPWAAAQNDTLHYGLHAGEKFTQRLSVSHTDRKYNKCWFLLSG